MGGKEIERKRFGEEKKKRKKKNNGRGKNFLI